MSNQVYIPPINFNDFDNQTGSITSINAIEPLEYNKLNSNLSIKAATENNYGVITTGDQNIKGNKNFVDGLTLTSGTISTTPTKDTDITNKKYIDDKTTDLVKYNTSTKYLVDNKTNSNISSFRVNNLSINNQINGSSVSVSVSTNGYHGTDTKNITVFKGYVNGLTCIIFNKNTEINSYKWVSDIPIDNNGMIMDFSNFSDIYSSLPQMFELTGEASTYGGSRNVVTKTLKFVKSSGYKYTVQYDKSFPMNLFKLKNSIKNIDTYIFTSETNKIGTLTIDKGYLYNSPTESNNLVNKNYVDAEANEIKNSISSNVSTLNENIENAKTELNGNIESAKSELNENITTAISQINTISLSTGTLQNIQNADNSLTNKLYVDNQIGKAKLELTNSIKTASNDTKAELNQNITDAINNIKIDNVNLTTGTISTDPANDTDITNKKYIDNAKAEMNAKIISTVNGIKNVDLTTGTISTTPTNNNDISNKKYVDSKADEINNSINSLKSYSDSNFIKYNSETNKLFKSSDTTSQQINNLNIDNLTSANLTSTDSTITNLTTTNLIASDLRINNSLNIDPRIIEFKRFSMQTIFDSNSQGLISCVVIFFKIKIGDVYFINIKLNFLPFTSGGTTLFIKNLNITDIGESYGEYNTYLCFKGDSETEGLKAGRCQFYFLRNDDGTYNIEIRNTQNGDKICKFDDFECAYNVVST